MKLRLIKSNHHALAAMLSENGALNHHHCQCGSRKWEPDGLWGPNRTNSENVMQHFWEKTKCLWWSASIDCASWEILFCFSFFDFCLIIHVLAPSSNCFLKVLQKHNTNISQYLNVVRCLCEKRPITTMMTVKLIYIFFALKILP